MTIAQSKPPQLTLSPKIRWEKLPDDFPLEDDPVENLGQPLLAGALRESLELANWIQPEMLIVSNFGLCAQVDDDFIVKAPDWLYVPSVFPKNFPGERRSYTPHAEGTIPAVVMEFLSETNGDEYSVKRITPFGKWFFYEQILQVPVYVIFEPIGGLLECYELQEGRYQLKLPNEDGRNWIASMNLFLGTWRGTKEERTGYWLRWWDKAGKLLLWGSEMVDVQRQRAEEERQRAEEEHQRAEEERQRAEEERQRAEEEHQRAEEERQRAEEEHQRAEGERQRADNLQQQLAHERAEREKLLAYLRSQGIDPKTLG